VNEFPVPSLLYRLKQMLAEADQALARLDVDTLLERRQVRGEEVTILLAIYHAVESLLDAHGPNHHAREDAIGRSQAPRLERTSRSLQAPRDLRFS
jgi:hypothetical protein